MYVIVPKDGTEVLQDMGREEPGEQTCLHVGDPRATSDVAVDGEGSVRRGPVVEDGVHVADQQDVGPARAPERTDDEVAEPRLPVVRPSVDLPPVVQEASLAHVRDLVHPCGRVGTAVDVDHGLEHVEELRVHRLGAISRSV